MLRRVDFRRKRLLLQPSDADKGILSEFDALNFFTKQLDWYQDNKITLTLDTKVESIDTAAKKVKLSNGEERPYDKLILATGAECNIPPINGATVRMCM